MINEKAFKVKKDGTAWYCSYCIHPEQIENYELAIADKENVWLCHHKLEAFFTKQELIEIGKYYNRPARELVFCRNYSEHENWPHKGLHSEEYKEVNRNSQLVSNKILCIETGIVYPSTNEASRQTGIHKGSISKVCRNERKTAGGFHWKYV